MISIISPSMDRPPSGSALCDLHQHSSWRTRADMGHIRGERGRYVIPAYLRRFRTFPTETAGLPGRLSGAVRERCDSLLFLCIHSGNIKGKTPYKLPCSGSSTLFVRRWPTRPPPDRESRDKQLPNGPKHSGLIHEINV